MMEREFEKHGKVLPHIIGPGMGHAYHPETRDEVHTTRRTPWHTIDSSKAHH